ncbi:hypothetical protein DSO57_1028923 [Entomophthora muscae]|uniref:Uncharacterized protein n=1 Tax=Entomophthora muscae TaxID=34485 RepID=A0ACC2TCI8_9FUNG|nr:hypothetical protein DSO57_1028923 [Entomophthora muscae]
MVNSFNFPYEKIRSPKKSSPPYRITSKFDWSVFSCILDKKKATNSVGNNASHQAQSSLKDQCGKRPLSETPSSHEVLSPKRNKESPSSEMQEDSSSPLSSVTASPKAAILTAEILPTKNQENASSPDLGVKNKDGQTFVSKEHSVPSESSPLTEILDEPQLPSTTTLLNFQNPPFRAL